MLYLKKANYDDIEQEYLSVSNTPADENGFINEWCGVNRDDFAQKALTPMIDAESGKGLPEGYVPETFYFLWNDDNIVGQFRLRHYLCPSLVEGAGHIGYFIHPDHRGKGYATEGLRLLLSEAEKIVPEDEIYLRLNKDNAASLKVMLKNGGYLHHEDEHKYYVCIKNAKK